MNKWFKPITLPTRLPGKEVAAFFPGCSLEWLEPPHWLPTPGPAYQSRRQDVYLNVAVVIEQYIFQLQVPVDHTILQ